MCFMLCGFGAEINVRRAADVLLKSAAVNRRENKCSMERKDLEYIELFELYKGLLTDNQRKLFESHYLYDLSLSEIAEPEGKTRQSVSDAVRKVKKKLDEYEKTLKLKERNDGLEKVAAALGERDGELSRRILELIGR